MHAAGSRGAAVRVAWGGIGVSLMLAILVPLVLLSHPARGVGLPEGQGSGAALLGTRPSGSLAAQAAPANTQDAPGNGQGNGQGNGAAHSQRDPHAQQLSRAQIVALVQRRYRARVVRTHLLQDANGRALYEFRLLSSAGKVWTVRIDAYSGAELP
jgi:hypothetical protein